MGMFASSEVLFFTRNARNMCFKKKYFPSIANSSGIIKRAWQRTKPETKTGGNIIKKTLKVMKITINKDFYAQR